MISLKNKMIITALFASFLIFSPMAVVKAHAEKCGVVNFKECVEKSKSGMHEQSSFEALKKQAEEVMKEKEKTLSEVTSKLNDPDYLDSLSQEAKAELQHKYRSISQEMAQQQQQLYQTLTQANYKVVQKLTEEVNDAAKVVAQNENFDLIINEDASFYYSAALDITDKIIKEMNNSFDKSTR